VASFARGFDQLVSLGPHEIQFGILKRLRGTPIIRHTEPYKMVFDPYPPYTVLATDRIDFATMQRLVRFARYWDLVANSGRFAHTLNMVLDKAPFERFMALSDWLYANTDATHRIALDRLAGLVTRWLVLQGWPEPEVRMAMARDYAGKVRHAEPEGKKAAPQRQARHLEKAAS
jgi:hypothetical protein